MVRRVVLTHTCHMSFILTEFVDIALPPVSLPAAIAVAVLALLVLTGTAAGLLTRIEDAFARPVAKPKATLEQPPE